MACQLATTQFEHGLSARFVIHDICCK